MVYSLDGITVVPSLTTTVGTQAEPLYVYPLGSSSILGDEIYFSSIETGTLVGATSFILLLPITLYHTLYAPAFVAEGTVVLYVPPLLFKQY